MRDIPTDMLTIKRRGLEPSERLNVLRDMLGENRRDKRVRDDIWEFLERNNVFAVEDEELTQTTLVKHEIETDGSAPIRQKTRPVPLGARAEFKHILDRGIIEKQLRVGFARCVGKKERWYIEVVCRL